MAHKTLRGPRTLLTDFLLILASFATLCEMYVRSVRELVRAFFYVLLWGDHIIHRMCANVWFVFIPQLQVGRLL